MLTMFKTGKAYKVNVTDAEDVKKGLTQSVKDLNGRLDIFVANAGIPWTQGNMIDGELDHYRKVVTTDLDGVYYCARAAGEIWRRQAQEGTDMNGSKLENYSYGSFIATASMSGHIVNFPQLQSAYNAAKAAVLHLTKCLAVEGQVCKMQLCLSWLHRNRTYNIRTRGNKSHLEEQDSHGS
jgi:sorbose reductase